MAPFNVSSMSYSNKMLKQPPNPKSLPTFSHVPVGILTVAGMVDMLGADQWSLSIVLYC